MGVYHITFLDLGEQGVQFRPFGVMESAGDLFNEDISAIHLRIIFEYRLDLNIDTADLYRPSEVLLMLYERT